MILYFSATGNSEYVARYLADHLGDEIIDLSGYIRQNKVLDVTSEKPYVVVSPVYVSVLPMVIENLLSGSTLAGSDKMYFVMTCAGSGISASAISAERVCKALNKTLAGVPHLSMPQNYLMYFTTASKEENDKKFAAATTRLPEICEAIASEKNFPTHKPGLAHKMLAARPMIRMFDKMLIGTKKFTVNDDCISCGLCEKLCPKNVISIQNGRPVWAKEGCLHCTACINRCPKHAINYGGKTLKLNRYVAKKYVPEKSDKQN